MGTVSHDIHPQRAAQQFARALQGSDHVPDSRAQETGEFDSGVPEVAEHRPQPREVAGVPVTVLTTDMELCGAIRGAVMNDHPLFVANRLEDAVKFAATGRCPVLITDQALDASELARIAAPLRVHDPALVIIVVGNRGEDGELKDLVSARAADRFLLKPVTPALTRVMIESVAREYRWRNVHTLADAGAGAGAGATESTQSAPPETVSGQQRLQPSESVLPQAASVPERAVRQSHDIPRPPWAVVVAVAAAVAVAVWWIMSQRLPDIDPRKVITTNLTEAQQALDAGRYIDPPERSALHYYSAVLALDPANVQAKSGVDRIADGFIEDARKLIAGERFADAVVALEKARRVRPEHQQLPALETQLRIQLETQLLQARESTDTSVPQRAGGSAVVPSVPDKVRAASRVSPGASPGDMATSRSLRESRSRILLEANEAIALGQFDTARQLITEAEDRGVAVSELAKLNTALILALETSQRTQANNALLQLVLQRTAENHLVEPAQDSAKHYLNQLAQTDRQFSGLKQGVEVLGARLVANAQSAITQKDFDLAARLISHARDIGFTNADVDAAEAALRIARTAPAAPEIALPAEPRLVKLVQPDYPDEARLRGIEGWVDLSLAVTASGDVINPRVENSSMNHLFGRAALAAVKQWKYETRATADPDQRMRVRVQFRLKE